LWLLSTATLHARFRNTSGSMKRIEPVGQEQNCLYPFSSILAGRGRRRARHALSRRVNTAESSLADY